MRILRELTFIEEQYEPAWTRKMKDLLLEIKDRVEQAKAASADALDPRTLRALERRYEAILQEGFAANPTPTAVAPPDTPKKRGRKKQSPAKNLLDRLQANRAAVLALWLNGLDLFTNLRAYGSVIFVSMRGDLRAKNACGGYPLSNYLWFLIFAFCLTTLPPSLTQNLIMHRLYWTLMFRSRTRQESGI